MRRLGIDDSRGRVDRNVDGLLDVMQDAMGSFREQLDDDRLKRWHSALFPGGTSGIRRIPVGEYHSTEEPMQIVSGPVGREKVHYQAPPSSDVPRQMGKLLAWREETRTRRIQIDGIVRDAISHLW